MVRKRRDSSNFELLIRDTDNIFVKCTNLPEFIRAKKRLPHAFCVFFDKKLELKEGIEVKLEAISTKNSNGELRNNVSYVHNNQARFEDLRFLGKSGRGTKFDIIIKIQTEPIIVAKYFNAIKVSVDGPRSPRKNQDKQKLKKQFDLFNSKMKSEDLQGLFKSPSSSFLSSNSTEQSSIITEYEDYFRSLAIKCLNFYLEYYKCNLNDHKIFNIMVKLIMENAHFQMLNNVFYEYDYSANYNHFLSILNPLFSNQA